MLKAVRASVMLLVLVGNAQAGEILIPPAPQQPPPSANIALEPTDAALNAEASTLEVSDSLADAALELLAVLPALL